MFHSKITVILRPSILDPQGKAVEHAIHSLGSASVHNVRMGKHIELDIDAATKQEAERVTEEACKKLFANPVMEDYLFTVEERT
ncbi:MAG: phosphoribosylformylglycinamidine synthase subunit PurS [Bacteroidota bacterium]|nr:phosphoribosylformylglycinamidine synthase subunit PurS [Bacteroidota bacterium]